MGKLEVTRESAKRKAIIVAGDWYVDENWLVSPQDLYHCSHTGKIHYQARQGKKRTCLTSLCGASELVELLRPSFDSASGCEVIGFGSWNRMDDDVMQCAICSDDTTVQSSIFCQKCLTHPSRTAAKGRTCFQRGGALPSLCQRGPKLVNLCKDGRDVSTNRIIRCYQGHEGKDLDLLYRLDWTHPVSEGDLDYTQFTKSIRDEYTVVAVVVEDHNLGVIGDECIGSLMEISTPDTKWFVRTKVDNPAWLERLIKATKQESGESSKPRLTLDSIVSHYQVVSHNKGERRWWYGDTLGRASLELLGVMTGDTYRYNGIRLNYPGQVTFQKAAVILDDNTVFAKREGICYVMPLPPGTRQPFNIGRTTVFFAAIIAQSILHDTDFGSVVARSLRCAYHWSRMASGENRDQRRRFFHGSYGEALAGLKSTTPGPAPAAEVEYDTQWQQWDESSIGWGTVKDGEDETLQLWRGEGSLPGYMCVGGPKRDAVNSMLSSVAAFNRDPSPSHPLSCLLISSPGWGKSYLAKCLADRLSMEHLDFSIAQMATSSDLIDCLATIASAQNRTRKKVLVFLDEVNAEIEGNNVMGLLLGPLWDGMFVVAGKSFRLDPAVWVFASTDRLNEIARAGKGSDFTSRLNGPVIDLDALGAGEISAKCMSLIRKYVVDYADNTVTSYESIYKLPEYRLFCWLDGQSVSPEGRPSDEIVELVDQLYDNRRQPPGPNTSDYVKEARKRLDQAVRNLESGESRGETRQESRQTATGRAGGWSVERLRGNIRTEQVYLMVSLLRNRWGPIDTVDSCLLQLFHGLMPINGVRSMEIFASRFEGVREGKIGPANVPDLHKDDALRRHVILPEQWFRSPETYIRMHEEAYGKKHVRVEL